MTAAIFTGIGLAILALMFWLLFAPKWNEPPAEIQALEIEKLQPLHCRHFPQISQLLRTEDLTFIEQRVPASMARGWRRERQRVLRQYLNGLAEDRLRVERLARLIAALSPDVSRKQEWQWLWMGIQFRIMFRLLALRIAIGRVSLVQLARWTDFVASQAADLQNRMSQMSQFLPSHLRLSGDA
ncbi:MAG TPA: hypothetical protein VGT03_01740 [Candidatus Acidoferrales bacterium]|nr:hypothetical protein [Candidatus Acidoferrales bacterium]